MVAEALQPAVTSAVVMDNQACFKFKVRETETRRSHLWEPPCPANVTMFLVQALFPGSDSDLRIGLPELILPHVLTGLLRPACAYLESLLFMLDVMMLQPRD